MNTAFELWKAEQANYEKSWIRTLSISKALAEVISGGTVQFSSDITQEDEVTKATFQDCSVAFIHTNGVVA